MLAEIPRHDRGRDGVHAACEGGQPGAWEVDAEVRGDERRSPAQTPGRLLQSVRDRPGRDQSHGPALPARAHAQGGRPAGPLGQRGGREESPRKKARAQPRRFDADARLEADIVGCDHPRPRAGFLAPVDRECVLVAEASGEQAHSRAERSTEPGRHALLHGATHRRDGSSDRRGNDLRPGRLGPSPGAPKRNDGGAIGYDEVVTEAARRRSRELVQVLAGEGPPVGDDRVADRLVVRVRKQWQRDSDKRQERSGGAQCGRHGSRPGSTQRQRRR